MTTLATGLIAIRHAEPRDVPWLLEEARQFAAYYGMPWLTEHPDAAERMHALVAAGPFFVAERDGSRVGFLAAHVGPHFFNPSVVVATELLWWVTPSQRGTSAGARLLMAFEAYAAATAHADLVALPPHCPVDPASLERRGYQLMERSYIRMRTEKAVA